MRCPPVPSTARLSQGCGTVQVSATIGKTALVPLSHALGTGRVGQTSSRMNGTRGTNGTSGTGERNMARCLVPFDRSEGLTVEAAAEVAGRSVRTMRLWCEQHQIGRRIGGGPWVVSRVALDMLLDGDEQALRAYLAGDRESPTVVAYYEREGLSDLICRWQKITTATPTIVL